jgi:hypothetical protein
MKFNFFEKFGIVGFSPQESSHTVEFQHSYDAKENCYSSDAYLGNLISWDNWSKLENITPEQASYLLFAIDPYRKDSANIADYYEDIGMLTQYLANKSTSWSLVKLIDEFGADNLNTRMVESVQSLGKKSLETTIDTPIKRTSPDYKIWLRETWEKEGRPRAADFFVQLKRYKSSLGSPIIDHWTIDSKMGSGIKIRLSNGSTKNITKKTITNAISEFKKQPPQNVSIGKTH